MPYEFLTDQHLLEYGAYVGTPSTEQLHKYFYLEDGDLELIANLRYDHTRLGMAIQIGTLRFLGTFLDRPTAVPEAVRTFVANQLKLRQSVNLEQYGKAKDAKYEHQALIRAHLGYKEFKGVEVLHLNRFLYSKALVADERPIVLFDLATQELAARQVVLPGATTIAKLIVPIRERVATRLYAQLSAKLSVPQTEKLERLLKVEQAGTDRRSPLERLKNAPTRVNSSGLNAGLARLEEIRAVGVSDIDLSDVPQSRLLALARHSEGLWSGTIGDYQVSRRRASLLALVQHLERSATDDVLEIFAQVMNSLELRGQRRHQRERLRSLKDLDGAALTLSEIARVILDESVPSGSVRASVLERFGAERVRTAIDLVTNLADQPDAKEVVIWSQAIRSVGLFIGRLIRVVKFDGTPAAKPLLEVLAYLRDSAGKSVAERRKAPRAFVSERWASTVFPNGQLERPMYVVYFAWRLQEALKTRTVFVEQSHSFTDARAKLLQGTAWDSVKANICRSLNLPLTAPAMISKLENDLDAGYRNVLQRIKADDSVVLEDVGGVLTPTHDALEPLPHSDGISDLERQAAGRLPEIDLPELLLEIDAHTGFANEMVLAGEGKPRAKDFAVSVIAALVAQACNIGLKAVTQNDHAALNPARLSWVQQNYIRRDTILRANARIVAHHAQLGLAQKFGGGEVASADGLRFVVPVRTIHAGHNPKYFGVKRGITFYTLTSDQFTMLHGIVIPGTLRDSLFVLAAVLEQQTTLDPKEIMTDTAGYSDVIFGLFHLLGLQFSPRISDLKDRRYWRMTRDADYGVLNEVSRHKISAERIALHWEDILRLVGSLKLGVVKAPDVMRVLAKGGSLSGLGKAIAEIGHATKTMYLLRYISDEPYRRRIHTQLNRGESRGRIGRAVYHGHKGEMREKYRSGMEDQLGALGLVVNIITLWNTLYLERAIDQIALEGHRVDEEDVKRLSPLKWEHINVLGRYSFEMSSTVTPGQLRPLRQQASSDPQLLTAD